MNNLFLKIKFFFKKPPVIVFIGDVEVKEKISLILGQHYKKGKDFFIFKTEENKLKEFSFFFKNSRKPILVLAGEKAISFKNLPENNFCLIFNNEDEKAKEISNRINGRKVSFGFHQNADIFVSYLSIDSTGEANFKINYKGSSVPFWTKRALPREKGRQWIYPTLVAVCVGLAFDLNLVEISEKLNISQSGQNA